MSVAVVEQTQKVIVDSENLQFVTATENFGVVVNDQTGVTVVQENTGFLVVDQPQNTVVAAGYQGPPGPQGLTGPAGPVGPGEEDVTYSKRVDFVTENLLYRGEAAVGSSEASSLWRIRRIVLGSDGDVTETWADGTADFTKSWNLRTSYTYS